MHKFASSQINLPLITASLAARDALKIPGSSLSPAMGRESLPHVTVQYGLLNADPNTIREKLRSLPPFTIKFGTMNYFEGVEGGTSDCIFVSILDSIGAGGLYAARNRLKEFLAPEMKLDSRAYRPHCTLAYVRPGMAEHFKGVSCELTGKTVDVRSIMFCDRNGNLHECELQGKVSNEGISRLSDIGKVWKQLV